MTQTVPFLKRIRRRVSRNRGFLRAVTSVYSAYMGFVFATTRWRFEGYDQWETRLAAGKPFLIVHWHQRLAMMPFTLDWRRWGLTVLASDRPVAEYAIAAARRRGIGMLRLASAGDNTALLRSAVRELHAGRCLCITPDGSSGPRRVVKSGALTIAAMAQVPIAPLSYSLSNAVIIRKSWDHFMLPLPFGRGIYWFGDPFEVSRRLSPDDLAQAQQALGSALTSLDDACDVACGRDPG